jgi:hypothetical protein
VEKMSINPLKFIKRHEKVRALLVGKNGATLKMGMLIKEGDFVMDIGKDRTYGPVRMRPMFDAKGNPAYLIHEESGAPLEAEMEDIKIPITSRWDLPLIWDEKNNPLYPFEEETGKPVILELDARVLKLKTDPELMNTLVSKTMLSNVLSRSPSFAMLIMTAIAAGAVGMVIGQSLG